MRRAAQELARNLRKGSNRNAKNNRRPVIPFRIAPEKKKIAADFVINFESAPCRCPHFVPNLRSGLIQANKAGLSRAPTPVRILGIHVIAFVEESDFLNTFPFNQKRTAGQVIHNLRRVAGWLKSPG